MTVILLLGYLITLHRIHGSSKPAAVLAGENGCMICFVINIWLSMSMSHWILITNAVASLQSLIRFNKILFTEFFSSLQSCIWSWIGDAWPRRAVHTAEPVRRQAQEAQHDQISVPHARTWLLYWYHHRGDSRPRPFVTPAVLQLVRPLLLQSSIRNFLNYIEDKDAGQFLWNSH